MELFTITDRCIRLLKEIELGLGVYTYKFNGNNELANIIKTVDNKAEAIRQFYKNKSGKDIFSTDDAAIRFVFDKDTVFHRLAFIKALAFYVLSPIVELTNKDEQLAHTELCSNDDPYKDVIIDTVNRFGEPIYVKDLEDEFMRICPDVNSIGQYLVIARAKYKDLRFPYRKEWPIELLDFVYKDNGYSRHIRQAQAVGLITKQEAETILTSIWQVINKVNEFADWIVEMYDKIKSVELEASSNSDLNIKSKSISNSDYFDTDLSYVGKVYNYISGDVIPDTITIASFLNCVSTADFSTIWGITGVKRAKFRYMICVLSAKMPSDWYKLAAKSICSIPQKCSGAKVPDDWKQSVRRIK